MSIIVRFGVVGSTLLDDHAVPADLSEPAEEDDPDRNRSASSLCGERLGDRR